MSSEIRDKKVALIARGNILNILEATKPIVSVHEHLDTEELFFDNGKSVYYSQSLPEFVSSVQEETLDLGGIKSGVFAAAFFPSPVYERFRAVPVAQSERQGLDLYMDVNIRVMEEIGHVQHAFSKNASPLGKDKSVSFLPMPFLFVDPNQHADVFERRYEHVLPFVTGFKWHPFAQMKAPKDYVAQGYLDLAARHKLPTVLHCERPGAPGDLSAIFRDVAPVADRLNAPVDIAHMSFLHRDAGLISRFQYVYMDMCPWSAIVSADNRDITFDEKADKLAACIDTGADQLLFGLDSPYNWSLWSSGDRFGAEVKEELAVFDKAIAAVGREKGEKVLSANPRRFLQGLKHG